MKLNSIVENMFSAGTPVRELGKTHGFLIDLFYNNPLCKNLPVARQYKAYLKTPSIDAWKMLIPNLAKEIIGALSSDIDYDTKYADQIASVVEMTQVDPNMVRAGLLDISPNLVKKTPLAPIALSDAERKKFMMAAQPSGLVTMASLLTTVPPNKLKEWMRSLGKDGVRLLSIVKKFYPDNYRKKF